MGEWRDATLGDVIELKRGHDLPQQDRHRGTIPIVSSSGVSDYHSVPKVKGPGVVTGRYGTLGQVFYIAEDFWPLNTTLYVQFFFNETKSNQQVSRFWLSDSRFENPVVGVEKRLPYLPQD